MCRAENDGLFFSSSIKINYDLRFIRTVQDFIKNLAILAGADKEEAFQLELLLEECLVFIMDKYVDARLEAHIEITFKLFTDKAIIIEMTDIGPPINENKIPAFNLKDENTDAGLWYQLVQQLSDEFEFVNKLNKGWLIRIIKNIAEVAFDTHMAVNDKLNSGLVKADTSGIKSIRLATPDDAAALIDLAFMTYRYSNGVPEFYDVELLKKHIAEKLYDIQVVEHSNKIIGACSIKYSEIETKSAEVGSAMIMPEYRNSTAIRLLMINLIEYHKNNPRKCDFFVSYAVTTHTRSQKALAKIYKGYKPLSISPNFIPRPEYIGIEDKTDDRETLLNVYHLNDKLKINRIYVSTNQRDIIHELIANTGNEISISTELSKPVKEETPIFDFKIGPIKSAIISIESFGLNWFTALNKKIISSISSGIETVIVNIPSANPLPIDICEKLADLNLLFCGLSLRSLEEINLSYCLTTKPINFSLIKLYSPVAQKLLLQIENEYQSQSTF